MGDRKGKIDAIDKVPQGKAEREMKQRTKVYKSRDYTSYLLHHDLASNLKQRDL